MIDTVRQLSVFAVNQPGKLTRITRLLAQHGINIRAVTIASGDRYGVIRLLVADPDKAFRVLQAADLSVALVPVLAISMPDAPGGLQGIVDRLSHHCINVEDAYGFVVEAGVRAVLIAEVEDMPRAAQLLIRDGLTLLSPDELARL